MFEDRKNRDSGVGCWRQKDRDSEVGHLESERTGTVRWGVWRQKEQGQ